MSKIFNVIFLIINIEQILSLLSENNTDVVAIKFRTYYPYVEQGANKCEIYLKKIHYSKVYLELQTGNETSYKKGLNQTLNTIINLREIVLITTDSYFELNTNKSNQILCTYNTSISDTFYESEGYYKLREINFPISYSKESFKIYTDIFLENYNITEFNLLNTIKHNVSKLCGNIGLIYFHTESFSYNLLGQLHYRFSLPDFTFLFNYTNKNSDEGVFIFGNKPHIYLPNEYNESDLFPFYTKYIREFNLDSVSFYINDNLTNENAYIKINPDIEGFTFPKNYFKILQDIFFEKYFSQEICFYEKYKYYTIIYCDEKKFTEEMIKSFPEIKFKISNVTFKFTGEDLFYKYENNFYFRIIDEGISDYFDIGRLLFKKYIIAFNPESRQIFLYKNNENENLDNRKGDYLEYKYIIIIIVLAILLMILFPVGIYFGKKLSQKRNKKAYELNDGYDYTSAKENSESLFKDN